MEQWKTINGYENYEVSTAGNVRNKSGKVLKQGKTDDGYALVKLHKSDKQKYFQVHRLVADAFIPNPNGYETVDHIDGNKLNNDASNLQWMSRGNNVRKGNYKKVYCYELDQTFDSIMEAEQETGIWNISKACQGKYKTAGGMHWEYVENN